MLTFTILSGIGMVVILNLVFLTGLGRTHLRRLGDRGCLFPRRSFCKRLGILLFMGSVVSRIAH